MKKIQKVLAVAVMWVLVLTMQGFVWDMDVQATETNNGAGQNNEDDDKQDNNKQDDDKKGDEPDSGEETVSLDEIRTEAKSEIEEYANIIKIKVSKEIDEQIEAVIEEYVKIIDKLTTEASIEACVAEAKAAVDGLVPAEDAAGDVLGEEPAMPSSTSDFIMVGGNWVTPTATYGQTVNIVLPVVNMGTVNLNNVTVTPVTSNIASEWPFEIQTSGYTQTIPDLPGKGNGQSDMDRRRELTWTLQTRADALSGYHKLQFNVLYYVGTEAESATLTTYVKVNGAPGSGNVEAEGGGTSTPRVIVTGFETNPAKVNAGDTFTLTLHLKNTSRRTAVSNMLVNFAAPSEGTDAESTYAAFLPTSGSNTEYISVIGKGETVDLSIEMTAKADLTQKPYQVDVSMEYEDDEYTSYTSTADVSIPIYQNARFELSTPEILPESISVGSESNVMFSIYNVGKTTLYNVKVTFEGDSVTGGESFLGKIEAGGTGNVDAMITGAAATADDGIVKIVVTYEDESGNKSTYEQDMTLMVTGEEMPGDEFGGMAAEGDFGYEEGGYMEEEPSGIGKGAIIGIVVAVILVIVIIIVIVLVRRNKKKKAQAEEMDLLDDFDEDEETDIDEDKDEAGNDDGTDNSVEEAGELYETDGDMEADVENDDEANEGEDDSDEIS